MEHQACLGPIIKALLRLSVVVAITANLGPSASEAAYVVTPTGRQDDGYNVHIYGHIGQTTYELISPLAPYAQLLRIQAGPGETAIEGALIHFPLAGAPQQIVSATLRFNVDLHRGLWFDHINASVDNDVALWELEASQTRVYTFSDPSGNIHSGWIEVEVTEVVRQEIGLGRAFAAFNFAGQSGKLYLSESGELGPSLTIVPVPEPSSLVALLIGLGGYAGLRRTGRRSRNGS